jgi:anti-sigma factor RsiW
LKLQAWLDGELPPAEAEAVAASVEQDPALRLLAEELSATKQLLRGSELERRLPESREFFWSRIEREIRPRESLARPERSPWRTWLFRLATPTAIAAALAALLVLPDRSIVSTAVVESPLEDVGSVTFRSEAEGMTIVWINTR